MAQNAGASDARSIELIEIANEMSYTNKLEQKEKLQKEEEALRKTVEENPTSRRARLELAKFLFHQNQFSQSEELALSVLKLDASNANAFCLLGRIYGFGKPQDTSKSEESFKEALKSDTEYAKAHYFYAYLLRSRLFRYSEAEDHYKKAMELRPDDVTSYNDCAIMLVRQNRSNEAKKLYEKVLELQPDHSIAHFNLANLLRKDLKDYKSAERHFLVSIQKRPKFTAALNNYATMLHHQLRRYDEAEKYYLRALNIDRKYSRAHFNYANLCREHLKKYNEAQTHYLSAILNDYTNPNFYNNYGLLLQYALKEYRSAKKQYEIALKLDDCHALGHCNYATILMQMVDKKYNKFYNDKCDQFDDNSDDDNDDNDNEDPYFQDDNDNDLIKEKQSESIPDGTYANYIINELWLKQIEAKSKLSISPKNIIKHNNNNNDDEKNNDLNKKLDLDRLNVYNNDHKSVKIEYQSKSEWHFKKSILLNSNLVMAYNNYGCLLRRLEKHSDAKQMFAKALSIDPKFIMAKRNLERAEQKEKGIDPYLKNNNNNNKNNDNDNGKQNKYARQPPNTKRGGNINSDKTDEFYDNLGKSTDDKCLVM